MSDNTVWFSDPPFRAAGQITTEEFISQWGEGPDSFADDPPNADFTCEVDGEVVNYVVELTDPLHDGAALSYTVAILSPTLLSDSLACASTASLFIDPAA